MARATATRTRRIVRQRAKGPIDRGPGDRVRALRSARGLTQADLAGNEFSKGFISLLETGRTRVSLRAAEIIASKLGVGVAELLTPGSSNEELELILVRGESELRAGNAERVLPLLEPIERRVTGIQRARLLRLRGRALARAQRSRQGLQDLDEAIRLFGAAKQRDQVIRTLFDLAVAHVRLEERSEALHYALEVERALVAREIVDRTLELQVLTFLAGIFTTVGDFGSADARAERAKALAEEVTDLRTVAAMYETLARTREEQGDLESALAYAQRALAAHEQAANFEAVGSSWNTIGWVYVQRRQFARAAEALDRAARIATDHNIGRLAAYVTQTRAELALAQGLHDQALKLADESASHPEASPRCRALSLLVRARALAATDAVDLEVERSFQGAFEALKNQGRKQLARAHEYYSEALSARGREHDALAAARRALELGRATAL